MNILFIHGNYPAQFRNLASDLGAQGKHDIRFLTARKDPERYPIQGVLTHQYEDVTHNAESIESQTQAIVKEHVKRGEIIQVEIIKLIRDGFMPKLIFFHGGNGLSLFIKQILPKATLIGYFEWYFSKRCANLILNRSDTQALNYIQARNISTEAEILISDSCVAPTQWQALQFPKQLRSSLNVIFDGIDVGFFKPGPPELFTQTVTLEGEDAKLMIRPDEFLLTYATRGMEPLRGFPDFMKALPKLLKQIPNLKVLIGGRNRSAYGPACPTHDGSWKEMALDKLPELRNHPRITYTGLMNYSNYLIMLQRTNLHCYLTKPYVTSWSLFEAAACGAPIITNRSQATSGIIPVDNNTTIDSVEAFPEPETLVKIKSILACNNNPKRKSILPPDYHMERAKESWQRLINQALKSS